MSTKRKRTPVPRITIKPTPANTRQTVAVNCSFCRANISRLKDKETHSKNCEATKMCKEYARNAEVAKEAMERMAKERDEALVKVEAYKQMLKKKQKQKSKKSSHKRHHKKRKIEPVPEPVILKPVPVLKEVKVELVSDDEFDMEEDQLILPEPEPEEKKAISAEEPLFTDSQTEEAFVSFLSPGSPLKQQ